MQRPVRPRPACSPAPPRTAPAPVALALAAVVGLGVNGLGAAQRADAPPPPAGSLTLQAALARAREHAAPAAAARERLAGATRAAALTPRWLNPSLEVSTENLGGTVPTDAFVVLTQPLEVSGTRGARLALADADRVDAEAAARLAEQQTIREVARTYLQAVQAREALGFIGEQREGMRDIVTALERRLAEGVAAEADLRKFEAELAQVETESLRLDLDLWRSVRELGAWLALPSLSPDDLAGPVLPPPTEAPSDAQLQVAIDARADVQAARSRVNRAARVVALERARGRPDVSVSGGYKRTAEENTGVVGVFVPIPLGDRNQAAAARAEAEWRALTRELDGLRALARADAIGAITRAQALNARAGHAAAVLVEPATVVRDAARASFREGAFDALRLVDAERAWTQARRTALALQVDAALAALEARFALGQEVLP